MVEVNKCLDTYALVEIANKNPKFSDYSDQVFVITDLTLAEFYSVLLREEGEGVAKYWYKKLELYSLPVPKEILVEAVKFRHEHKKQGISFFDAVGYIYATRNGYPFVTGDKEFEHFVNVECHKTLRV